MISIGEVPRSAPRDYPITSDKYAVLASRCTTDGKCDIATAGNLHLSTLGLGKSVTGEHQLHFHGGTFESGTFESGAFDAIWVGVDLKPPVLCG